MTRVREVGGIDAAGNPCADVLHVDAGASALLSISPATAQVSGGTPIWLHGRGFPAGSTAHVRFHWRDSYNKGPTAPFEEVFVPGVVHNDKVVGCTMPNVCERLVEGEVHVEVIFESNHDQVQSEVRMVYRDPTKKVGGEERKFPENWLANSELCPPK